MAVGFEGGAQRVEQSGGWFSHGGEALDKRGHAVEVSGGEGAAEEAYEGGLVKGVEFDGLAQERAGFFAVVDFFQAAGDGGEGGGREAAGLAQAMNEGAGLHGLAGGAEGDGA